MTVNRTTLLDLPLPVTGTEAGTWGDVTNNGLTQYLDVAIAGMSNLTSANFTTGALTIETTEGDSIGTNITATSAQYAGFRVSSLAQNSIITVGNTGTNPARSYRLINADATYTLTFKATGQNGITLQPGQTAVVAFNGTDYVIVGMAGAGTVTDNAVVRFDGTTGKLVQNSVVTIADSTGDISGVGTLNATTADLTNLEVTNIKAKDGTAAGSIADSTGVVTLGSSVLTTTDINGGTIDNTAIGGATPAAGAFTTLSASSTLSVTGAGTIQGLTVGRGAGAVSTNTAVGASVLANGSNTGVDIVAVGRLALTANSSGGYSVAVGSQASYSNTTGNSNVAVGYTALYSNTTGSNNIAIGQQALQANTTASNNTAVGYQSLYSNITGGQNTAFGQGTLYSNTASENTAFGRQAGYSNTSGTANVFMGLNTAYSNTTGSYNVALGYTALQANTTASNNTAVGYQAGYSNTTGSNNAFLGKGAGYATTTGGQNTALGVDALLTNTTFTESTAVGYTALRIANGGIYQTGLGAYAGYSVTTGTANTLVGAATGYSMTTGSYNTFVGVSQGFYGAGHYVTTGSKNTILGGYTGNQGGLDIRTASNRIVLSDGDGNPRWYIDNVGAAGYSPTTGGTVTQATSRTTGVTLNTPTGAITLVSAAGTTTWQTFTVTNSSVAATDTLIVNQKSGTDLYEIHVTAVAAGSFNISFKTTGGTTTEQPVFNYALIKGQTS